MEHTPGLETSPPGSDTLEVAGAQGPPIGTRHAGQYVTHDVGGLG